MHENGQNVQCKHYFDSFLGNWQRMCLLLAKEEEKAIVGEVSVKYWI